MYTDKYDSGDHASVAEELLMEVPAIELKCKAVVKSVSEGYFTLPEALQNYKVSEIEYIAYSILSNRVKIKGSKKAQAFETISFVVSTFTSSNRIFDKNNREAINEIKKIAEKSLEKVH